MAVYQFACHTHGSVDIQRPIGTAPESIACPACGADARRVFASPMIGRGPNAASDAIERCERSAEQPDVVTSIPRQQGTGGQAYTHNPAHQKLPRP